jgi:acyl-coenzyme A synthetase/AMP-(fatty) acid ligase
VVLADDHDRSLTTAALRDQVEVVASGLQARGVGPGDSVSWQLPTTLETAVLLVACARLGVTQNPIIPVFRREVALIVEQVDPRLVVVPERWRGFEHADHARSLGREVLALDLEGDPGPALRLPAGSPTELPAPETSSGACRWIYYSSGTTAEPKGVRHSDASVIASSNGVVDGLGMASGDSYPIAWPIAHIGDAPLFPALRTCVAGGAATPSAVNDEVREVLGVSGVVGAWGLTEFPVATSETPDDPAVGTTVGRPATGVQVRVVDGELCLKGPSCSSATSTLRSIRRLSTRMASVADVAVVGRPHERTGEQVCAVVVVVPGHKLELSDLVAYCRAEGLARYKCPERLQLVDELPRSSMGKVVKREITIVD